MHLSLVSSVISFLVIACATPVIFIENSHLICLIADDCARGGMYRSLFGHSLVFVSLLFDLLWLFHEAFIHQSCGLILCIQIVLCLPPECCCCCCFWVPPHFFLCLCPRSEIKSLFLLCMFSLVGLTAFASNLLPIQSVPHGLCIGVSPNHIGVCKALFELSVALTT